MAEPPVKLSPTQRKLWDVLSDGKLHSSEELLKYMPDELMNKNCLRTHITYLRYKLKSAKLMINCQVVDSLTHYQLLRFTHITDKSC